MVVKASPKRKNVFLFSVLSRKERKGINLQISSFRSGITTTLVLVTILVSSIELD